jgi:hypothetical protein
MVKQAFVDHKTKLPWSMSESTQTQLQAFEASKRTEIWWASLCSAFFLVDWPFGWIRLGVGGGEGGHAGMRDEPTTPTELAETPTGHTEQLLLKIFSALTNSSSIHVAIDLSAPFRLAHARHTNRTPSDERCLPPWKGHTWWIVSQDFTSLTSGRAAPISGIRPCQMVQTGVGYIEDKADMKGLSLAPQMLLWLHRGRQRLN